MAENKLTVIHDLGQSIWLDFIERDFVRSGKLQKLIEEDGVRGVTSNPAIFEKAISGSQQYDKQIEDLFLEGNTAEDVFYSLAIKDIQDAADLFFPLFNDEKIKGADGFVSLEVSPELARNTEGTISQALDLWEKLDRKNAMIKIPGTAEGLLAIKRAISEGLNINVTLIFSLKRYKEVTEAYITGLESRDKQGKPINEIASVASFFLSRIDALVDTFFENNNFKSTIAVALAKKAYEIYQNVFTSERWKKLEAKGAKPQRLLWASTSSKNSAIKDTFYVEELIAPNTVNTITLETLEAFRDHGKASITLEGNLDEALQTLESLENFGISLDEIAQTLENEGIEKFIQPYRKLLKALKDKNS